MYIQDVLLANSPATAAQLWPVPYALPRSDAHYHLFFFFGVLLAFPFYASAIQS